MPFRLSVHVRIESEGGYGRDGGGSLEIIETHAIPQMPIDRMATLLKAVADVIKSAVEGRLK